MKNIKIIGVLLFCLWSCNATAQEINFSSYASYGLTVNELSNDNLHFGALLKNEGTVSIPLSDAKIIAITGVKYLDVIVSITADDNLLDNPGCSGDPNCSIPFTLEAAYANLGQNNIGQVRFFTVNSNNTTARFPVLRRTSGPPAPPPPPPRAGFDPSVFEETAYLYIYGSINVGDVNAGYYTGNITITVSYN